MAVQTHIRWFGEVGRGIDGVSVNAASLLCTISIVAEAERAGQPVAAAAQ